MEDSTQNIYIFSAATFAVFMLLESALPRRDEGKEVGWRWLNNFSLSAITWYVNFIAGTWLMIWLARNHDLRSFAIVPAEIGQHPLIGFLLLLLVGEFIAYVMHVTMHKVRFLWPIHAVHHADTSFDVSTGYRHHPLEPLLLLPLVAPAVILLGTTPAVAAAYRFFAVATTVFSHANVRLPEALDKALRPVFITPDYHRIHHCAEQQYTNSNYGTLVPWFDYLFGTARTRPYDEQESMEIGLEYWRDRRDLRLDQQLLMPFRKIERDTAVEVSQ